MCVQPVSIYSPLKVIKRLEKHNLFIKDYYKSGRSVEPIYNNRMNVPCGSCILCRSTRRLEWSLRLTHESMYHRNAVFLTLTIDDDHMNSQYSLRKHDYQCFLKRLRKRLDRRGKKIRYFGCGEYGERTGRPHYHFIIFGLTVMDYTDCSDIERSWELGNVHIKASTVSRMMYVAGYTVKKIGVETDNLLPGQESTFRTGSQGIGREWIDTPENRVRVLKDKCCTMDGFDVPVPRYYKNRLVQQGYIGEDYFPEISIKREEEEFRRYRLTRGPFFEFLDPFATREILIVKAKTYEENGITYHGTELIKEYERYQFQRKKNHSIILKTKQEFRESRGVL